MILVNQKGVINIRSIFTKEQLKPPSKKQLAYIKVLEKQAKMKFYGTTTREAIKFIERAKQSIIDHQIIKHMLEREEERLRNK